MSDPEKKTTAELKTQAAPPAPYVAPLFHRYLGLEPLLPESLASRVPKKRR
jgi:hypothetical protein